jgi:hypothetical protein
MNKEKEPTGIWTWPDTYSDLKLIEVTVIDVKYIRSLLVGWDIAELGAPGLMTRDGVKWTPRQGQLFEKFKFFFTSKLSESFSPYSF